MLGLLTNSLAAENQTEHVAWKIIRNLEKDLGNISLIGYHSFLEEIGMHSEGGTKLYVVRILFSFSL